MTYIGNGRSLLLFNSNTRDDITPTYINPYLPDGITPKVWPTDGLFDKFTFNLSKEVPGGYEENLYVFRKKYITENLISSGVNFKIDAVAGDSSKFRLLHTDPSIAATLSSVRPKLTTYSELNYTLTISGSSLGYEANNGTFNIESINYTGSSLDVNGNYIEIVLIKTGAQTVATNQTLSISYGYSGFWEILEPRIDYVISGSGANYNKQILLSQSPQFNDKVYVIHKSTTTNLLQPSPYSVDDSSFSDSVKKFVCDRFTGNGTNATFVLSQSAYNSKSLIVSVDGVIKDGDDETFSGEWQLSSDCLSVIFDVAPTSGAKIRILHINLGTVSVSKELSPGQISKPGPNVASTASFQDSSVIDTKLDNFSVTTEKILNNAVSYNKILLQNNTALNSLLSTISYPLLKNNSSGVTEISSVGAAPTMRFKQNSSNVINVTYVNVPEGYDAALVPETTNIVSLGSSSKKLSSQFISNSKTVDGNISVGNSCSLNGTITNSTLSSLSSNISDLTTKVNNLFPLGTMMLWPSNTVYDSNWVVCDGSAISRSEYSQLFDLLCPIVNGVRTFPFGQGNGSTTFNVPDMRRRSGSGRVSGTGNDSLGDNDGISTASSRVWTHTHTGAPHTHDLSNHTHSIPAHYHGMGTGATLNILASNGTDIDKGGHDTAIDIFHDHTASSGVTSVTINSSSANVTFNDPGHNHGMQDANPSHGHTGTTNLGGGAHDHDPGGVRASSGSDVAGSTRFHIKLTNRSDYFLTSGIVRSDGSEHQHTFGTGNNNESIDHAHGIDGATTRFNENPAWGLQQSGHAHSETTQYTGTITNGSTVVSSLSPVNSTNLGIYVGMLVTGTGIQSDTRVSAINSGTQITLDKTATSSGTTTLTFFGHRHTITVSSLGTTNRTDSSGVHSHSASNFSGLIGLVTGGVDGNTVQNTTSISNNNTGSATYTASYGNFTVPHLILNYIIKAKDVYA